MNLTYLLLLLGGAFAISVPFGIWRARTRKFSVAWFSAIHLPIPAVFILRMELGFSYWIVPVVIASAVAGQIVGGRLFPPSPAGPPAAAPATPASSNTN